MGRTLPVTDMKSAEWSVLKGGTEIAQKELTRIYDRLIRKAVRGFALL
jgi:hypothetical protein